MPEQRRQRASYACDFCHTRGLKCRRQTSNGRNLEEAGCLTCTDYGAQCTLNRPIRRRGRKPQRRSPNGIQQHGSLDATRRLIRVYRNTMYQCYFPFLPEKDLLTRWENGIPDKDGPSYMLLMALCAVSSQTVALNAVFDDTLVEGLDGRDSNMYYSEAISKIPAHAIESQDLDYLRSFGLLALHSLRSGNPGDFHRYLGLYHALVAQNGFHDESRWPRGISMCDVDDRRRLFWCVYRLEIHSACVMGHIVRMPEAQVSVLYPRITPAMDPETSAWTAGWDYITDLFRLLEYAIFSLRERKNHKAVFAVLCDRPSPTTLLDSLARLKASKPRILLLDSNGNDCQSNRCRYMAIQITCTESLVNIMALLYCQAPARQVTDIAEVLLEEVTNAPLIMFKVASNQIVDQLLGVGHMLYNASQYDSGPYQTEAKRLIAFLGDLVQNLEHDIPSAAKAGKRLLSLAEATL
jgi:Fungal specific transcription factor domain/Fungal Zn(2)-Cys(6) binuclear cluster domain